MPRAIHRNIDSSELFQDDSYGIEGTYLICLKSQGNDDIFLKNGKKTEAGRVAEKLWNDIPVHFTHVDLKDYSLSPRCLAGILDIDVTGRRTGVKEYYYNIVSQYEIAFGMMVGRRNPFQLEGSVFHIISWMKASSLIEIRKLKQTENFRWVSGYFDFELTDSQLLYKAKDLVSKPASFPDDSLHELEL